MFKDDYKKCNVNIKADPVLVESIIRQTRLKKKATPRRTLLQRVGSIAAAFLILVSSMVIVYKGALNNKFVAGVKSYSEVYTLIKAMNQRDFVTRLGNGSSVKLPGTINNSEAKDVDFSDTNLQVLGVQEADIVKTDGKYIYAISVEHVYIIGVEGQNLTVLSKINRNTSKEAKKDEVAEVISSTVQELYIIENRLVLIKLISNSNTSGGASSWYTSYSYDTAAEIYDISDKENPKHLNTLGQNGYYVSSRMIEEVLYLVTNHNIYKEDVSETDPSTYIPYLYNDNKATLVNPGDICITPSPEYYNYLIVTGIDAKQPDKHVSTKTIFGSGSKIYSSLDNLYVAASSYRNDNATTDIIKFSLDKGEIGVKGTTYVPGNLLNQFAMDEYNGYLRICTTSRITEKVSNGNVSSWSVSNTLNNLYVLNDDLKLVGKIEGLAKGESIYSVRFDGDVGYFVTFRRTDPLFTVDLEDPEAPKVLSELKIPGFSNYLHMYKDNLLFGFGMDADPDTGITSGLKLSMFDVSDKKDVTEKHTLALGNKYSYSEAQYNHKAILVSPERNLIGIYSNGTGEYLLFSYNEEKGFKQEATLKAENVNLYGMNTRGFYINDMIYVFTTDKIVVFSLDTFEKLNTLFLYNR